MPSVDANINNTELLEQLYDQFQKDLSALDAEWLAFFKGFEFGYFRSDQAGDQEQAVRERRSSRPRTDKGVLALLEAYRQHGHLISRLDPLGNSQTNHALLELSAFTLTEEDLDKGVGSAGFLGNTDGTLRDLLDKLRTTYCGSVGVDFTTVEDTDHLTWLRQRIEPILNRSSFNETQSHRLLWQLIETEEYEQFLHTRYIGQKRFSVEGGEALLPLIDTLIETGADLGLEEMVLGMAHRGRLNVLAHILHKPYEVMLSEFEGAVHGEGAEDEGDVKYHQGYSYDHVSKNGHRVHLSLSPNPSHLELVNPLIEGMVQAKQDYLHDEERSRVIPVQIHGEAAFTGQGIVAETLNLSQLEGYTNGGTIHVIFNNQVGYTANPAETRFTRYPTDVARQIQAPVFHVNADDPEAVVHVARLAMEFRQCFKEDVLIDLWCYRRYGHNEADDPTLTQPLMYQQVAKQPTVCQIYSQQLLDEGKTTPEGVDAMRNEVRNTLERCQEKAQRLKVKPRTNVFGGAWQGLSWAGEDWNIDTAITRSTAERIAAKATEVPEGFNLHRTLKRITAARREMVEGKLPVDWGCGEMLALGSLLMERIPVRLAGQDSQRGTFAHRHSVWHDVKNGEKYVPLSHLAETQGRFEVLNTMLSELAVVGFEYGISSADPRRLIMWEAQFGDFVNGAQLVIDQYLSGAEAKWHRMNGMVLLLPHGYEGMGPEHSSARLERFLQLCAKNNMQVCYPTSPAQLFHVLRRQMHRNFRKPLILMTPKSLLRNKLCTSDIGEFLEGGFQCVIGDSNVTDCDKVYRLVLCTGKIYYDIIEDYKGDQNGRIAVSRLEQLYPFPQEELSAAMKSYPNLRELVWVQEEAENMGAWYFARTHLEEILPNGVTLSYVGRDEAASPAVGASAAHQREQADIVEQALQLESKEVILEDVKRERLRQAQGKE